MPASVSPFGFHFRISASMKTGGVAVQNVIGSIYAFQTAAGMLFAADALVFLCVYSTTRSQSNQQGSGPREQSKNETATDAAVSHGSVGISDLAWMLLSLPPVQMNI